MVAQWTAAKIAKMHRLAGEGLSASKIAAALGVTKNAIIGKMHRVGSTLTPRARAAVAVVEQEVAPQVIVETILAAKPAPKVTPIITLPPADRAVVAPVVLVAPPAPVSLPAAPVVASAPVAVVAPPAPVLGPCTIANLTDYRCHWPIGDPMSESFTYCGAAKAVGGPYCIKCAAVAYYRPTGSKSVSVANFRGKLKLSGTHK